MGGTMGGMAGMGGTMGAGGYQQGMNSGMGGTMGGMGSTMGGAGAGGGVAGARSAFANRLQGIIRSSAAGGGSGDIQVIGIAKIIADERTNSLLVFADKNDLQTITNIIAKLDVVLAQVLIEAVVMDVTLSDTFQSSFSYVQGKASQIGDFTGSGSMMSPAPDSTGFNYAASLGQDLDVTVKLVASDSRGHVIQRPRILTSHAKQASIFVGSTEPYVTGTYGGGYGGAYGGAYGGYGGAGYSQYQQVQIGINLSILPFINAEGLVVMDINQRIQGVDHYVKINGNDVPVTSDKEATAYIAVRDRDTVMLGGFISSTINDTHAGVPWLKDIPLLGFLFKSTTKNSGRKETVILMRPTVINTPELAAVVTAVERDGMPGIRHSESAYEKQTRAEAAKLKVEREQEQEQAKKDASKRSRRSAEKLDY